ncbi:SMP-30/gluconolactonase/LRE family protein [Microbacterium sp. NPDC055903]
MAEPDGASAALIDAGLIPADARLEQVHTGSVWIEGPLWISDRGRVRFSDIPNDCIREYDPASGETAVYASGVEFTNGRTLDADGSVLQCSHGRRRVERDRDGVVENVVDGWNGVRLNSPNDIVVAGDGAIWFTDPAYGITEAREGHPGEREYGDHYVFRHDPRTGRTTPAIMDVEQPNGLAFSPDGSLLYVADSSPLQDIRVYDVQDGGRCKNGRVFARLGAGEGVPDGIRIDARGRVWSSSGIGVVVFDPDGSRVGAIHVPEVVANLCFGGADGTDLYIAATTSLYRIRMTVGT